MEYVVGNLNNISLVSNHFFEKLCSTKQYQLKCKENLHELVKRRPGFGECYEDNIEKCIKLIQDKDYVDKFFLINYCYLTDRVNHQALIIYNLSKVYSPSLANFSGEFLEKMLYKKCLTKTINEVLQYLEEYSESGEIHIHYSNLSLFHFDIKKIEEIFKHIRIFRYDKYTFERIYLSKIQIVKKLSTNLKKKNEYIRSNFSRKEIKESKTNPTKFC